MISVIHALLLSFFVRLTGRLKGRQPSKPQTPPQAWRRRLSTERCACLLRELFRECRVTSHDFWLRDLSERRFRDIRAGRTAPTKKEVETILELLNGGGRRTFTNADVFGPRAKAKRCTCELRRQMDASGLTAVDIARYLGVDTRVVHQMRSGASLPTPEQRAAIAALVPTEAVVPIASGRKGALQRLRVGGRL